MRRRRFMRGDDQTRSRLIAALAQGARVRRQQHRLVGWPRGTRHERWSRTGEGLQERLLPVDPLRAGPHLIETRVARDLEHVGAHTECEQAVGTGLIDRADALQGAVGVAEQEAGQCACSPRSGRQRGTEEHDGDVSRRRALHEIRPHVELHEHQHGGLQRVEHRVGFVAPVKGQVVRDVGADRGGKPLGTGREIRVGELPLRMYLTPAMRDGARLQPFTYRRGVDPHQRSRRRTNRPAGDGHPI